MADKLNVERLFTLPYFQQMFDQMVKPMADTLGQILCDDDGIDPRLIAKVTEEAHRHIYQGMVELVMNLYVEVLSDEEVEFLREAYQHPAFLKLQNSMQSMMPMMVAWFEENQGLIQRSIERALDEAS